MNDKTFLFIGIFFFLIGGAGFLLVTTPWKNSANTAVTKQNTPEPQIVVLNIPKQKNISLEAEEEKNKAPAPLNTIESAEQFFTNKNFIAAIEIAYSIHNKSPEQKRPLEILVDSHMALSEYFQAEESIQSLLMLDNNPQNHVKHIEILMLAGKKEEAKTQISQLPESEEKLFYQLLIAVIEENHELTRQHANTLIQSNSQYSKTAQEFLNIFTTYSSFRDGSPHYLRTMMANMLNILDYHTLTIQFLKPTITEHPDYRDAFIITGNSYLSLKKFPLAQHVLEQAISLDPAHPKTPYFLAIALAELGQYDNAIEQFQNALKNQYQPESKVQRYIADTFMRQKQYDKALEYYQEVLNDKENAEFDDYIYAITLAINELDSPDIALKTATKMHKAFPQNPRSLPFLGWTLLKTNNIDQARKSLLQSIEKNPHLGENYLFMGQIYEHEKRYQEAFDSYKKGYQIAKGQPVSRECAQRYNTLKNTLNSTQ